MPWAERPNELEVRHLPLKEVGANDVLIQVGKAGICPWDLRAFSGLSSSVAFPRVLGHEMAGVVAAVGENVKFIKPIGIEVCDMNGLDRILILKHFGEVMGKAG